MTKREFPKSASNIVTPKFEYIPDELKTRPFWCCWKEIKKPTRIKSGQLANGSLNVPSDWLTFDQSVQIYAVHSGWGIGMLLNGDGLITIDIDGCVQNDTPSPESLAVMREHGVGYVEFSPSGMLCIEYEYLVIRGRVGIGHGNIVIVVVILVG